MTKRNEFLDKEITAIEKKKTNIAYVLALVTLAVACLIGYWFTTGTNALVYFMFIFNILFGPVTLFFYLREVKKGVFRADVEADTEEE